MKYSWVYSSLNMSQQLKEVDKETQKNTSEHFPHQMSLKRLCEHTKSFKEDLCAYFAFKYLLGA